LAIENPLARSGTEIGQNIFFGAGFPAERSNVKLARLPDITVSGGFWEERNTKAKVNKTIKIHVEWAVSDCGHVKKKIPNKGDKNPLTFFLERKERF
jgi:hypothetical protein